MSNRQRAFTLVEQRLDETRCNHRRGSSAQHGAHDSRIQVVSALIDCTCYKCVHGTQALPARCAHACVMWSAICQTARLRTGFGMNNRRCAISSVEKSRHRTTLAHARTHAHSCSAHTIITDDIKRDRSIAVKCPARITCASCHRLSDL